MKSNSLNELVMTDQQTIPVCLISASREILMGLQEMIDPQAFSVKTVLANDDHSQALLRFERVRSAQVVILDLSSTDDDMLDVLHQVQTIQPRAHIIVLHLYGEDSLANKVIEAGAKAYLPVNTSFDELAEALKEILKGQTFVSRRVA